MLHWVELIEVAETLLIQQISKGVFGSHNRRVHHMLVPKQIVKGVCQRTFPSVGRADQEWNPCGL